jgi:hypothetical protein
MDDAAGTTVMMDGSGNGNDGVIQSNAAPMLLTGVNLAPPVDHVWHPSRPSRHAALLGRLFAY